MKAFILLNFKTYKESTGKKAVLLAKSSEKARKNGYELAVAPSLLLTKEIVDKTSLQVYAQHTDHVTLGAHTGRIPAKELKEIGVKGTILNHSERKIPFNYLVQIVEECKRNGLSTVVCASSLFEIKKIAALNPTFIAYEPKELIGGETSVTEAKPKIIVKAVETLANTGSKARLLCGAGVHSKEDLGHALLLGTSGVLIGHSIPKAKNPRKFLEGMLL